LAAIHIHCKDMLLYRRSLFAGVCSLLLLSGCGFSSNGSSFGSSGNPSGAGGGGSNTGGAPIGPIEGGGPAGSADVIVATPSDGAVSVAIGAAQTVSITFTSNDGNAISGFAVSGTLATLPAGWSGPGSFSCASVSTGSGCVLYLTYAPTAAVDSGTLTIDYVFVSNAAMPSTGGSVTIAYTATTHDNVIAAASPAGQINGIVGGGNQSVSVSFTTDDGNAATGLTLTTGLAALPPGWSSTVAGFSCAIVSTGSGCQLPLTFTPTAGASGTLALAYGYTDDSGTARAGTLNIPYSTVAHNSVVATVSPPGEIVAVETGSQAVTVTFNTDDGNPASTVYLTSDLTALPAGWSSASNTLSCASVSTGNGCQLHLTYAPTTLTSGTLTLNYAYTDAAGTAGTGSLNLAYAATTNDNAVATVSPTGLITAVAPAGTQAVLVTFTTDDGRPATALQLTSSLTALPAGWSSASPTFSCNGFGSGNGCQLALTYAPAVAGNGTLTLNYTYMNNAGESKTGSVSVAYTATTNNNIGNMVSPPSLAVFTNSSTPVTVTFATDDGNPATGLSITSGLSAPPAGWSSPSPSFTCPSVSAGTTCQLSLTYAPTLAGGGTLYLTYGYNDNSGTAKSGTVSIAYAATVPHLYVAELFGPSGPPGLLYSCSLDPFGALSGCAPTGNGFTAPSGIAFYGSNYAYVTDFFNNAVYGCTVDAEGSLSLCADTLIIVQSPNFQSPFQLAVNGSTLYITNGESGDGVTTCAIGTGGALSNCAEAPESAGVDTSGIAVSSSYVYVGVGASTVDECTVGSMGGLTHCTSTGSGFSGVDGMSLANGYAYITNQSNGTVSVCSLGGGGSLSPCAPSTIASGILAGIAPSSVAVNGGQAYVYDSNNNNMYLCSVGNSGALEHCGVSNGGTVFSNAIQIAIH
jgi:hypothetical protein